MPKEKVNPYEFESPEYIALVARVNEVMSHCLGLPLDPVDGAAKYEVAELTLAHLHLTNLPFDHALAEEQRAEAESRLKRAEGRVAETGKQFKGERHVWAGWPRQAAALARPYASEFPWLAPLFGPRDRPADCPVWRQVADDLRASPTFRDGILRRVRRNPVLRPLLGKPKMGADREEAENEVVEAVIPDAQRIVIGKAAYLRDKAAKRVDNSWLKEALYYGKRAFTQYHVVIVTGEARLPVRDATTATADPPPTAILDDKPGVQMVSSLHPEDDADSVEQLLGEGREPSPEAGAIQGELRDDITKLTSEEQQVIRLRYYEEKAWTEAAAEMGCTVYQAQRHHHSALAKLRRGRTDD